MTVINIEHVNGKVRAWIDGTEVPDVSEAISEHRTGNHTVVRLEIVAERVEHGAPARVRDFEAPA